MSSLPFIPYNVASIGPEEIGEVTETLRSGWLTTGPRTHRFEDEFREYTGARYALALSSGTAALHLPLAAMGIGPGDEVITTPLTFCATVSTIIHVGATPVLADIGENGNIDPASIRERLTPRTRAIMPVHYAGLPCDMQAIWELARQWNLKVIEDAAHASGTWYGKQHVGSARCTGSSDAAAFSFYATKNITTGEGGMVTTNDEQLHCRMRRLALHGISKDAWNRYAQNGSWHYTVEEAGFKYNLSDLQSALGLHQRRKLEDFVSARTRIAALYRAQLGQLEELELPPDSEIGRNSWHLYVVRLNLAMLSIDRARFIEELHRRGIGTSVHFIPIPLHPFFAPWAKEERQQCPRALAFYERAISLPMYPSLTEEQVIRISSCVTEVAQNFRKMRVFAAGSSLPIPRHHS